MKKVFSNFALEQLCNHIKKGNAVFFFGAGASSEIGLYTAWPLVDQIIISLADVCNKEVYDKVLKVRSKVTDKAKQIDWPRLEKIMQLLIHSIGMDALNILDLYDLGCPSDGHTFIVQAFTQFGCNNFFTTNFDTCLEKAIKRFPGVKAKTIATQTDYKSLTCDTNFYNFLLHGTLPKLTNNKGEIVVTIDTILRALPEYKWRTLFERTRDHALIFVGYSASDIDLRPRIAELALCEIYWVDIKPMSENINSLLGKRWSKNFIQMPCSEFFNNLRNRLRIPLTTGLGDNKTVLKDDLIEYVSKWARGFNPVDVVFFFIDLFIFLGDYQATHRLLDNTIISELKGKKKFKARLKRAEVFSREFKFTELRKLIRRINPEVFGDDIASRLLVADYNNLGGDVNSASKIANSSLKMATSNADKARSLRFIGKLDTYGECTERGERTLRKSANLFHKNGLMEERVQTLNELAVNCQRRGKLKEAEQILSEVVDLSKEIGDTYQHARAENNLGEVYRFRGMLEEARKHYDSAAKLALLVDAEDIKLIMLCNYGLTYWSEKNYSEAKKYFTRAIDSFSERRGILEHTGNAYLNLGMVLIAEEKGREALKMLNKAYLIFEKLNAHSRINAINLYKTYANISLGNINEAEKLYADLIGSKIQNPLLKFQVDYLCEILKACQVYNALGRLSEYADNIGAIEEVEIIKRVRTGLRGIIKPIPII